MSTPFPAGRWPTSIQAYRTVTPLTYRDGATLLELFSAMRNWLENEVVGNIEAEVDRIINETNDKITALLDAVTTAEEAAEAAAAIKLELEGLETRVNEVAANAEASAAAAAASAGASATSATQSASSAASAASELAALRVLIANSIADITAGIMENLRIDQPLGVPRLDARAKVPRTRLDAEIMSEALVHDVMTRHPATGQPVSAQSGHVYKSYVMGGDPSKWVNNNGLLDVADGYPAGYLETDIGETVGRIGATFSFDSRGESLTSQGMFAMMPWADGGYGTNGPGRRTGLHIIVFSPGSLAITQRSTVDGDFTTIAEWHVGAFSKNPSVVNTIDAHRAGDTVTISLNGRMFTAQDSRLRAVEGEQFACWEPYYPGNVSTAIRAKIRSVWADGTSNRVGNESSLTRQAIAHSQSTVMAMAGNAYVLPFTGSNQAIPATQFTITPGATGSVHVMVRAWLVPGDGLTTIRVVQDSDGYPLRSIHMATTGTVAASYVGTAVISGLTRRYRVRLEVNGPNGGNLTFGDDFSGRQISVLATPC